MLTTPLARAWNECRWHRLGRLNGWIVAGLAAVLSGLPTAGLPSLARAQSAEGNAESVRIVAHLRDLDTGEALAGAVIELAGVVGRHVTDVGGRAAFNAVLGDYELVVRRSGYETVQGDFRVLRAGDFFLQMAQADLDNPAASSRLLVRVADAETERPIEGAAVSLISGATRPTDVRGSVSFDDLSPVLTRLTVEMIGYAARTEPVVLHPGRTTAVEVGMTVEAIELEPIVVEVRSPIMEAYGVYDRLERGIANRVLTRDAIEQQASHRLSDALRYVPGLDVRREGSAVGFPSRAVVYARGCRLAVWVDGVEWHSDIEGTVDIDQIAPEWIEMAEFYWGLRTPTQFSSGNNCGTVLIWTRQGRRR